MVNTFTWDYGETYLCGLNLRREGVVPTMYTSIWKVGYCYYTISYIGYIRTTRRLRYIMSDCCLCNISSSTLKLTTECRHCVSARVHYVKV